MAKIEKAIPGIMTKFRISELSGVDRAAQKPARACFIKRDEAVLDEFIKREFSDEKRQELADAGKALPDGSFPIENEADLHNAISAFGRAKDKAKAKAHIVSRAQAMGMSGALPDGWVSKANPGPTPKESAMDKELLKSLGLPETATAEQVVKALQEQNAKLAKEAADAGAVAAKAARKSAATPEELAYIKAKAMSDGDADDFLAKPKDEKAKKMADLEKSDETLSVNGATIRKSEVGEGAFTFMKAQAAELSATKTAFAKAEEARKDAEFAKRAGEELPNTSGTLEDRAAMLKGIDAIADDKLRKASLEALHAADKVLGGAFQKWGGHTPPGGQDSSLSKAADLIDQKARELMKADPKLSFAKAYDQVCTSDPSLYEKAETERRERAAAAH